MIGALIILVLGVVLYRFLDRIAKVSNDRDGAWLRRTEFLRDGPRRPRVFSRWR